MSERPGPFPGSTPDWVLGLTLQQDVFLLLPGSSVPALLAPSLALSWEPVVRFPRTCPESLGLLHSLLPSTHPPISWQCSLGLRSHFLLVWAKSTHIRPAEGRDAACRRDRKRNPEGLEKRAQRGLWLRMGLGTGAAWPEVLYSAWGLWSLRPVEDYWIIWSME